MHASTPAKSAPAPRNIFAILLLAVALPSAAQAQSDTTVKVAFGAFVDGYYAWDFGRPPGFDRSFAGGALFTTQPARHNEFNVNLAFVEAKLDGPRIRGRLALQAGTSVQSNYSGEPTNGAISGASLGRVIQEAVVGTKLANNLWVDGGVFFSHMGMESWISRDNLTYTRSLVAEYSPYYQSGVKMTWTPTRALTAQVDVVNGWQNISENNSGKGAGARVDYTPGSATTVSYYNFFSDEAGSQLRTFNGVGVKRVQGRLTMVGQFDIGSQNHGAGQGGTSTWYGYTAMARLQATPQLAVVGRFEGYHDPDQVIIATGSANSSPNPPFKGVGASLGIDVTPQPRLLWRTELRGFANDGAIFPNTSTGMPRKSNALMVTSMALTF
ncbi:MAG: outer membrane beta-barrel protein [Gemmatimonadaceae bacterium]